MWAFTDTEMLKYIKDLATEHGHGSVADYLASNFAEELEDAGMYAEVYHAHCIAKITSMKSDKGRTKWQTEQVALVKAYPALQVK